jgi:hypothetical protein
MCVPEDLQQPVRTYEEPNDVTANGKDLSLLLKHGESLNKKIAISWNVTVFRISDGVSQYITSIFVLSNVGDTVTNYTASVICRENLKYHQAHKSF